MTLEWKTQNLEAENWLSKNEMLCAVDKYICDTISVKYVQTDFRFDF